MPRPNLGRTMLGVRILPDLRAELERIADAYGVTVTDVAVSAMKQGLPAAERQLAAHQRH